MQRIDLNDILQRTVSASNGDLVTRRTGQRVRAAIEQVLAGETDGHVAGLDFGTVRCLDLSCADEIVGRLLREHTQERCVLLNVTEAQRDAIDVPLDWDEPNGRTISLALIRHLASKPDQRIGTLFINPGGPGGPGLPWASYLAQGLRPSVAAQYDIVGFDTATPPLISDFACGSL